MESLILLGFVLLGALFISLGFGHRAWQIHRAWRRISSFPSSKLSGPRDSIKAPIQSRHFRETDSSDQQPQFSPARRQVAVDGRGRRPRPTRTEKIVTHQRAAKHAQPVNPAIQPWGRNQAQQAHPNFKLIQNKSLRPVKPANGHSTSIPLQPLHPTFKLTQVKRPRQTKPADKYSAPPPLKPNHPTFKPTLEKRPQQTKLADRGSASPPPHIHSTSKPTQARRPRQAKPADKYSASSASTMDPVFQLTQIRRSRSINPVNDQPRSILPQPINSADEPSQLRPSRRNKPAPDFTD